MERAHEVSGLKLEGIDRPAYALQVRAMALENALRLAGRSRGVDDARRVAAGSRREIERAGLDRLRGVDAELGDISAGPLRERSACRSIGDDDLGAGMTQHG